MTELDGARTEENTGRRPTMATTPHASRLEAGRRIFTRTVVGVAGSPAALDAARQAALLRDTGGRVTLLAAWDIAPVLGGTGSDVPYYYDEGLQREAAQKALATARDAVAPYAAVTTKLMRSTPAQALLDEIDRDEGTLVAVGASRLGRLLGIAEGSIAGQMIHRAPCSVLVARATPSGFPRRVVVGVDGSAESAAAYAAALYAARRSDAELRAIVAVGGKGVDERGVAEITDGDHEEIPLAPVAALRRAADDADLVVTGSRGLHGPRALGSVSERVAFRAACSVLVVRLAAWQRNAESTGR